MRATSWGLCAALLCGTAITLQAESTTDSLGSDEKKNPSELRTWTDNSGTRTAKARLLEVRNGKARLQKANGKFSVIVISQLSDGDQAFLAALPSSAIRTARRPSEQPPVADGLLTNGKLPGVGVLLNSFQAVRQQPGSADNAEAPTFPLLAPAPDIMPARLVHIRVSRRLLEQNIEKVVVRQHPVVDNILGTSLRGNARTSATTTLSLLDNPNQAVIDVVFSGVVKSQTQGVNGPVVLHGSATTPFYAAKRLALNANGMSMSPTVTQARTSSVTHDIDSTLPRLRGRIAERIAWRRSAEMRSEADAIASQHAATRIRAEFDKEVQQNVARIERILIEGTRDLPLEFEDGAPSIHFSSTPKHLDIVMLRSEATPEEIAQAPPAVDGDPLLAIRAHRVAVRQALTTTALKQMVQNLLSGNRATSKTKSVKTAAVPEAVALEVKWSPDRNWLMFDHFDQSGQRRKPKPIQLPVAQAAVSEKPTAP